MLLVGLCFYVLGMCVGGVLYEYFDYCYYDRFLIWFGIIGLVQVNGLCGDVFDEVVVCKWFEYDLFYVEQVFLWFDMKIIFKMICWEFFIGSGNQNFLMECFL